MVNILTRAIMMSTPLLLGALAEVYAERTGMMICAIEGIFLIGAWGGFVGTYLSGSLLVGLLLAIALGGLMALLYAFVTVTLGQQQVVTGTAMNILAVGFCSYFQRVLFGVPTTPLQIDTLPKLSIPLLSKIPFIGEIFFQQNILTYMAYILIPVSIFVLYKTSLGLAIRSTGENPVAVDVAGRLHRRPGGLVLHGGLLGYVQQQHHWRPGLDRLRHLLFGQLVAQGRGAGHPGLRPGGCPVHLFPHRHHRCPHRAYHRSALYPHHRAHHLPQQFPCTR